MARQQKSSLGGRPPVDPTKRRSISIGTRLTTTEAEVLRANASASGHSPSSYIRSVLVRTGAFVPPVSVPSINRQAHASLGRLGNNLNQLVRRAHAEGIGDDSALVSELKAVHALLREIRDALFGHGLSRPDPPSQPFDADAAVEDLDKALEILGRVRGELK